jgi:hypothetical protein
MALTKLSHSTDIATLEHHKNVLDVRGDKIKEHAVCRKEGKI